MCLLIFVIEQKIEGGKVRTVVRGSQMKGVYTCGIFEDVVEDLLTVSNLNWKQTGERRVCGLREADWLGDVVEVGSACVTG